MSKDPRRFQALLEEWNEQNNQNSLNGQNGHNGYHADGSSVEHEEMGLTDELDHEILMHRDVHFGGDFSVMLDYYADQGVGVHPDFELERIAHLRDIEQEIGENLAGLILSPTEAEKVAKARAAYIAMKEFYEADTPNPMYTSLADLILSEEEEPIDEMEKVVAFGERIVPDLVRFLENEEALDPLFPGYGYAPHLAAQALGSIGDERAIRPLFSLLGKDLIFDEEVILDALAAIGQPAKEFLLSVIASRPLTSDNVHAAYALTAFCGDMECAKSALNQLIDTDVQAKPLLSTYLLTHCDSLQGTEHQLKLIELAQNPSLSSQLRGDLQQLLKGWE